MGASLISRGRLHIDLSSNAAEGGQTHTWFSPFGARNHAPAHMAATMNRPMKMLHLDATEHRG